MGKNFKKSPSPLLKRLVDRISDRLGRGGEFRDGIEAGKRRLQVEPLEERILYSGSPASAPAPEPSAPAEPVQEQPVSAEPSPSPSAEANAAPAAPADASEPATADVAAPAPATGAAPEAAVEVMSAPEEEGDVASESAQANGTGQAARTTLTQESLATMAQAAAQRWIDSGLTDEQIAILGSISYQIADLGGHYLGLTEGNAIMIDDDAGGTGAWFIDDTPDLDEEFRATETNLQVAFLDSQARGHYDLLTVILHEQGHILGLDHNGITGDVMEELFDTGQRRNPLAGQAANAGQGPVAESAYVSLSLPNLVVNEILANPQSNPFSGPASYNTNGDLSIGANDEFIEVYNTSGSDVDVSGLQFWDTQQGNWFTVPNGTIIASGGTLTVVKNIADTTTGGAVGKLPTVPAGSAIFDAAYATFMTGVLDNGGDVIRILDAVNNEFIEAKYGSPPAFSHGSFPGGATQIGTTLDFGATVPAGSSLTLSIHGDPMSGAVDHLTLGNGAVLASPGTAPNAPAVLISSFGIDRLVDESTTTTLFGPVLTVSIGDGAAASSTSLTVVLTVTGSGRIQVSTTASGGASVAGNDTDTVTLTGTVAEINATLSAAGAFVIPPSADYNNINAGGLTTFTVTATDATLNLTDAESRLISYLPVNDPPTITTPPAQSALEDTDLVFSSANGNLITVGDVDAAEGTGLVKVTLGVNSGTLTLSTTANLDFATDGNIGDGTSDQSMIFRGLIADVNAALAGLIYRGNLNFNSGTNPADSLSITVNDLGNTGKDQSIVPGRIDTGDATSEEATSNVTINVTPVNDAPVNGVPSPQSTDNETPLVFSTGNGNAITVGDVDVDETSAPNNTLQVTLSVENGTLTLSQTTGLTFATGDGTADATMTFTGNQTNINAALDGLQFIVTTPGFTGNPNLTIVTDDLGHSGIDTTTPMTSDFFIELEFDPGSGFTTAQMNAIQAAAIRWQSVIVGDLPDEGMIDDIKLFVTTSSDTGEGFGATGGTLATGGYDALRAIGSLPYLGTITFDTFDIADLTTNGTLESVATHEIGHALGLGTLWDHASFNLVTGTSYMGTNALNAHNFTFSVSESFIPLENTGDGAGSHWAESVYTVEIMTPNSELPGIGTPISIVSVASLVDLGYAVDYRGAGTFNSKNGYDYLAFIGGGALSDTDVIPVTVTATPPVFASLVRLTPAGAITNADTLIFRATFSEAVQNVTAGDFVVTGGTTATITNVNQVTVSTYDITVSGGDLASFNGTLGIDLAGSQDIEDLFENALPAGEPATDETYTVDNTAPVLSSFLRATPAGENTADDTLVFLATFGEDVQSVDAADFTVTGGTTATITGVTATSASTYEITISGGDLASFNGTVGLDLAGGQNIIDLAGNALPSVEPTTDQTYTVDNAGPVADIINVTPDPRTNHAGTVMILFDEDVTGFDINDLSLTLDAANVDISSLIVTGSGSSYGIDLTSVTGDSGVYVLTLTASGSGIVDGLGNAITVDASDTWEVNKAPTDISLSANTIAENTDTGSGAVAIGTLTATDPEGSAGHTFTLVAGSGDADNGKFEIVGGELRIKAGQVVDFETQPSYTVRVNVNDGANDFAEVFLVEVTDVNESPTDIALSANTIAENTDTSSAVAIGTLTATDPDAAPTHTFTLVAGTGDADNGKFEIVGGELRIKAGQVIDFETQPTYTVRVNVNDGANDFAEVFLVEVTDVNESPTDISLSANTIAENTDTSSAVAIGTLTASDPDAAPTHTFTLVAGTGDADNGKFEIVGGVLRIKAGQVVDFETQPTYTVRVNVNDGANDFAEVFLVEVTDVNEAPTDIALSANSIAENTDTSSAVAIGTLTASDPDAAPSHTFTLVAGSGDADNSKFEIVGGVLRIKAGQVVDFETQPSYSVRVNVNDGANDFAKAFTVEVTDVNEAPTDIALSANSIAENTDTSSAVAIGTLTATDPDAAPTHTFTLVAGSGDADNSKFEIVGGELRIKAGQVVDFETQPTYTVRVNVNDGANDFAEVFLVEVTDVNEAPTDIALSANSIAENTDTSSAVAIGTLTASDPDAAPSHTFTLVAGTGDADNGKFEIVGGELRIKAGQVVDFETQPSYTVRVNVNDGANDFAEVFLVEVTDVNESPTDISLSANTIAENTDTSSAVAIGTLTASDPDAAPSHTFTLVAGSGDADNSKFEIVGGVLRIKAGQVVDFETQPSYTVRVNVNDGANDFAKAFLVEVTDVNEAPTDIALSANSIAENTDTSSAVAIGTLTASDPDAAPTHTFTLVAGSGDADNGKFEIVGGELRIKAGQVVDFETQPTYTVRVNVNDGANDFAKAFTVEVTDVNESPTDIALSANSIAENTDTSSAVAIGTLTASDPDAAPSHTFTLVAGTGDADNGKFEIVGGVLRIKAGQVVDFETQPSYSVRVNVNDGANDFAEVFLVEVTDVNESPTDISLSANSIAENTDTSSAVAIGTLTATDPDAAPTHTFTLVAGTGDADNGKFEIVGGELRIKAGQVVDFETQPSYTVRVNVNDGANDFAKAFTVVVTDVNEAPTDIALSANTIAENTDTSSAVAIGTLTASDPDAAPTHTFTLVAGSGDADNGKFEIVGGVLRIKAGQVVDFETQPTYTVRVNVNDGANDFAEVFLVEVTDVNESPTDIALSANSIAENTDTSSAVAIGTLTASDPDAAPSHTFTLVAGSGDADNGKFEIVGGVLRIKAGQVVDFETQPSYSVRVNVNDGANDFAEVFLVEVTDVNESPTDIALSANSIAENTDTSSAVAIGTLTASDPDAAPSHTFTLVAGTGDADNGKFEIVGGVLRIKAGQVVDFETQPSYSVRVNVNDGANDFAEVFLVEVTDVNESPTDISLSANSIAENTDTSSAVAIGTLTATDPDAAPTHTFTLVAGTGDADNGKFEIVGGELRIKAGQVVDFETQPSYTVRVNVNDGANDFAKAFTVVVTDVNEAPTDIALSANTIAENTDTSSAVAIGTLTASDPDAAPTHTFTLVAGSGDADNGKFEIVGGVLRIKAGQVVDFETQPTYTVRVNVNDGANDFAEVFLVEVTDVNESPTDIALSANSIAENTDTSSAVAIGTLTASDPDAAPSHTFTLVAGTGDADNGKFEIVGGVLRIKAGQVVDFETQPTYTVRVNVNDGANDFAEVFLVEVTDVNESPTDIALSANSIAENTDTSSAVAIGTLTASDPDSAPSHTFTLVAGSGDADNGKFEIVGGVLRIKSGQVVDFETQPSYSVRVNVNDGANDFAKVLLVEVTDVNEAPDPSDATTSVAEDAADGTLVFTLSPNDPDAGDTHSFSFTGGNTDDAFAINSNGQITVADTTKITSGQTFNLVVEVRDQGGGGLVGTATVTVNVTDVNTPPSAVAVANEVNQLAENTSTSSDVFIADIVITDDGSGTNTISLSGADAGFFKVVGTQLFLKAGTALNFESPIDSNGDNVFEVTIEVDDTSVGATPDATVAHTVTVTDVNEAPSDISLSANTIAENTDTSSPVAIGTLTATDPDAAPTHTFTLVAGTGDADNGKFEIVGGELRIKSGQVVDFETQPTYTVRVNVNDGANDFAEVFLVEVTDVNESPTDIALSANTIAENTDTSSAVTIGTLTASDPDAAPTHTFTLVAGSGDADNGKFEIVGGVLRIKSGQVVDFETQPTYTVRVNVNDGANDFAEVFLVEVTDVNESPTDISLSANSIAENTDTSSAVAIGTLTASDPDAAPTHTFTLVAGTGDADNGKFEIVGGVLRIKAGQVVDFETQPTYTVRVNVNDGANDFAEVFLVEVTDVNESPTDIALSANTIAENTDTSSAVAIGTLTASDPDAAPTHTFTLVAGTGDADNGKFEIVGGVLRIKSGQVIDFETQPTYTVRVNVNDGANDFAKAFTVEVTDVNEAPTDIALSANSIAENTDTSSAVAIGTLTATDPDAAPTHTFTLVAGSGDADNGKFEIVGGVLRIKAGQVVDFETQPTYTVRVNVNDGANDFAEVFLVVVTDVNESPTDIALSANSIAENTDTSSAVAIGTLTASDPDAAPSHTFTLVAGTGDADNGKFEVVGGVLRIKAGQVVDFETQPTYTVRVNVNDGANDFAKAFTVVVTDVNESPTDIALSANSIAENTDTSSAVAIGTLTATDPDAAPTHTFTLVAGSGDADNGKFEIVGGELRIKAGQVIDFETQPTYTVRVNVNDGANDFAKAFTVVVTDVNESPTDIALSANSIVENTDTSSAVAIGTLTATDPDAAPTHTFTLVAGTGDADNGKFEIVGGVLRIKAGQVIDFETQPTYTVRVNVNDGANDFAKAFTVVVTDVNEAPTDIALSANTIVENTDTSSAVAIGTLTATDPDAAPTHTFTLVAGSGDADNGKFEIVGGVLRIKAGQVVDFETQPSYTVRVNVNDGANDFAEVFLVEVTDVNESPTDISLSANTIAENTDTSSAVAIGTLTASDPDAAPTHTFTLVAGTGDADNGKFEIVGGVLRIKAGQVVDFETQPTYTVRVNVNDGANDFAEVFLVEVTDVNEAPTDIALSANSIAENTDTSSAVAIGTLTASDPDAAPSHTFTLVAGTGDADNSKFEIVGGELRIKAGQVVDFETQPTYTVRVNVNDGANDFAKAFTVEVTDVNESPTDIALSANSIAENTDTSSAVAIGTLTATDPDAAPTHTFTLVAGSGDADNSKFEIVGGELRIKAGQVVDFETQPSYSVRVNVNDGANDFAKAFTVVVTDVNESPTDIALSANSIVENTDTSSAVAIGTLTASDPDSAPSHTFTLVAGSGDADNGKFEIVGGVLRIKAGQVVDFETQPSYSVRVNVNDGANDFAKVLLVEVTDVNEATMATNTNQTIAYNEDDASVAIGDIIVSDPDNGEQLTATLTLADPSAGALTTSGSAVYSTMSGVWAITGSVSAVNAALAAVSFVPATDSSVSTSIAVNIADGGENGTGPVTGTITLNGTAVNDAPSFTHLGNQTANEDAGIQSVTGFTSFSPGGGPDESGQTATYTVTNDNAALFIDQPTVDANGKLTYRSAADANGTATVTIFVKDNGGVANGGIDTSAAQNFTITINPVNDEPSFDIASSHTSTTGDGPQSVAGFASNLDKGAANESAQTLTFNIVSNTNTGLFSAGPAISADGTLTYTAGMGSSGTANIVVELMDNGGVANGGDDTSGTKSFTITVNPGAIVGTTGVYLDGNGDLVIEDIDGANTADRLTISSDGTNLIITDPNQVVGTNIFGATKPDTHTVVVAISLFDDIIVRTHGGADVITVASLTGFNQSLTIDSGGADGAHDFIDFSASVSGAAGESFDLDAERVRFNSGASIAATGSGTIDVKGTGGGIGTFVGVRITGATLSTEAGAITIVGQGGSTGRLNDGIRIDSSASVTTTGGNISLDGTAGVSTAVNDRNAGVYVNDTTLTTGGAGAVTITGTGSTTTGASLGVLLTDASVGATGTGGVNVTGVGGAGTSSNRGVQIGAFTTVTTASGDIIIQGVANGTGSQNTGVSIHPGSEVTSGGALTVVGTGSGGTSNNDGVSLNSTTLTTTGSSALTVTGLSSGSIGFNRGIDLVSSNVVGSASVSFIGSRSSNATTGRFNDGVNINDADFFSGGAFDLTGFGGTGTSDNRGISIFNSDINAIGGLDFDGTANGLTTGDRNSGVRILNSTISDTGTIAGTGGGGNLGNYGVFMDNVLSNLNPTNITGSANASADELFGDYFGVLPLLMAAADKAKKRHIRERSKRRDGATNPLQAVADRALALAASDPAPLSRDAIILIRDGGLPPVAVEPAILDLILDGPDARPIPSARNRSALIIIGQGTSVDADRRCAYWVDIASDGLLAPHSLPLGIGGDAILERLERHLLGLVSDRSEISRDGDSPWFRVDLAGSWDSRRAAISHRGAKTASLFGLTEDI